MYIFSKENFSYVSGNGTLLFSAQARKNKKSPPRENFLYFRKWKLRKKFFIFQETELSHISGNEAFLTNISLIFQEVTFRARKVKEPTLKKVFREMELFSPKFKKLLIFQERI